MHNINTTEEKSSVQWQRSAGRGKGCICLWWHFSGAAFRYEILGAVYNSRRWWWLWWPSAKMQRTAAAGSQVTAMSTMTVRPRCGVNTGDLWNTRSTRTCWRGTYRRHKVYCFIWTKWCLSKLEFRTADSHSVAEEQLSNSNSNSNSSLIRTVAWKAKRDTAIKYIQAYNI